MGYRIEYSASAQAKCKGPKPCNGTKIEKGELRLGTVVDFQGKTTWAWRHWGCVTPQVIANIKKDVEGDDPELLDGFEIMREEDAARITKAFETGEIDPADKSTNVLAPVDPLSKLTIPDLKQKLADADLDTKGKKDDLVARLREHEGPLPSEDEEESPKKKKAAAKNGDAKEKKKPAKKKAKKEESDEESEAEDSEEDEKPKKKAKKSKKDETSDEESEAQDTDEDEDEKPKKKTKKAAPKKNAKKTKKEESDAEESAEPADSDDEDKSKGPPKKTKKAPVGEKRKRPAKKEEASEEDGDEE